MYDRGLGYILAVIFGTAGVALLVMPIVAPDIVERSAITFIGGIFGVGLSVIFTLSVAIRKHCRRNRQGELIDKTCTLDGPEEPASPQQVTNNRPLL